MRTITGVAMAALLAATLPAIAAGKPIAAHGSDWSMNATIIEACSCPMFCQCYFGSGKPAAHHHEGGAGEEHFCKFNNALRINKGHLGALKLDGAKFWVSGNLGGDFSKGQMDWAVVTFDKATTKEQRDAITTIVGHLYPVKWNSLTTAEGQIAWTAGKGEAHATIDGGKVAEVGLKAFPGMTPDPVVIKNLIYWGAPRNDGFVLMPNTVEAYRVGDKAFEYKGTNGFMITLEIDSKSLAAAVTGSGSTSGR